MQGGIKGYRDELRSRRMSKGLDQISSKPEVKNHKLSIGSF